MISHLVAALLVLLFVWTVVTILGHASWVLLRTLFQTTPPNPPSANTDPPRRTADRHDVAAMHRVLDRLIDRGMIDPRQVAELRRKADQLARQQTAAAEHRPAEHSVNSAEFAQIIRQQRPIADAQHAAADEPQVGSSEFREADRVESMPPSDRNHLEDEPAHEHEPAHANAPECQGERADEQHRDRQRGRSGEQEDRQDRDPLSDAELHEPDQPALSRSEIIHSFLAAHNIRWGELVAGLLIIVCSIGLVISLWNTIAKTRLIPSLIFLGGNAAIFAAGFYTLSRWRLRHTSRSVLVIATLLVPLSILAGLAATGDVRDSVWLTDPVTWGFLAVAGSIYGGLLWRAGVALVGRVHSRAFFFAVAGPAAVLPWVSALLRALDDELGWVVGAGTIPFALAVLWEARLGVRNGKSMGVAAGRNRLSMLGLGGFSLASLTGYVAWLLSDGGLITSLPMAIAWIPALIGASAAAQQLASRSRSGTQAMIGSVVATLTLVAVALILPAAMIEPRWLWWWGGIATASGLLAVAAMRRPVWLMVSTLPLGIAVTLTSGVWLGGSVWQNIPLWRRIIGGEPLLAVLLVAVVSAGLGRILGNRESGMWMKRAAATWSVIALLIAAVLSLGPVDWLGIAPRGTAAAVLMVGAALAAAGSLIRRDLSIVSVVLLIWVGISVGRPVTLAVPIYWQPPPIWMLLSVAVSVALLLQSLVASRLTRWRSIDRQALSRSVKHWNQASVGLACFGSAASMIYVDRSWGVSAATLATAATLCTLASLRDRSLSRIRIAQVLSLLAAVTVGYGQFADSLFARSAWVSGTAPWNWALLLTATVGIWFALREAARATVWRAAGPLNFFNRSRAAPFRLVDGPIATTAIGLVFLAAAFSFVVTLLRAAGEFDVALSAEWWSPLGALLATGVMVVWLRRHETNHAAGSPLAAMLLIATIGWASVRAAELIVVDPNAALMVAASLIMTACSVGWWIALRWRGDRPSTSASFCSATLAVVIAAASGLLLVTGWINPWLHGAAVHTSTSWVVAGWWLAASGGLLAVAINHRSLPLANLSAWTMPAAVVLLAAWFGLDHPVAWLQVAAVAALGWASIAGAVATRSDRMTTVEEAMGGSHQFASVIGLGSAVLVIVAILFQVSQFKVVFGPAGAVASAAVLLLWVIGRLRWPRYDQSIPSKLDWPVAITLLAGHIAWLALTLAWIDSIALLRVLTYVWCFSGTASVIRLGAGLSAPLSNATHFGLLSTKSRGTLGVAARSLRWLLQRHSSAEFWHAAGASVAAMLTALVIGLQDSSWMVWVRCAAAISAGVLVGLAGRSEMTSRAQAIASRLIGWFVLVVGAFFVSFGWFDSQNEAAIWTVIVGWVAAWIIVWRLLAPDRSETSTAGGAIPDVEASWVLWIAAIGELIVTASAPHLLIDAMNPWVGIRLGIWMMVAASTVARGTRRLVWQPAFGLLLVLVAVVVVRIAIGAGSSQPARIAAAAVSVGFTLALLTHRLPSIQATALRLGRSESGPPRLVLADLVQPVLQLALIVVAASVMLVIGMIAGAVDPAMTRLTIVTVALAGWTIAELSEWTRSLSLKHMAVTVALVALGLWASVDSGDSVDPWLAGSMRWLVLSVLTIPAAWLVVPRMLGPRITEPWKPALQRVAAIASVTATGSLAVMLMLEVMLRGGDGISDIALARVIGVALTLAVLSLCAALAAILSGPGWRRHGFELPDRQRQALIIAAQAIGALTWLHVFLCRPEWALVRLRDYWPYIVMGLAFLSAGATEWARRRDDRVLAATLRQTAMYLPLVPVIGFWLSTTPAAGAWWFAGGHVPYALLLAVGAVYYLGISALWSGMTPRIAAAVLGNAALWVILVQAPGWSFLGHPQAWLIPPAVCVLVISHLYRHRLSSAVASGIRYGGASVIYISSTADMLIADIGTSLMGPVILITLALIGMLAGVVLKIRPFLYVGATFVFIAVTSMVWHAQQAIGESWPWWVFGITTGIGLLAGLMAIEKNKLQLQRLAESLRGWEP